MKTFEELSLRDDFMFGIVMRNPRLCQPMLERILNVKILRIEFPESQKVIDPSVEGKGVRLDIYVADAEHTVYNVEMQTSNKKELPQRTRYYQGVIDLDLLEKGALYKNLPKSFVIFICTFDPFGRGRAMYSFENTCREDGTLRLEDGTYKIFLNTKGVMEEIHPDLSNFLRYIENGQVSDEYTRKLDEEVISVKNSEKWRREYMTLEMRDREKYAEGHEKGLAEGIVKGRVLSRYEDGYTLEEIAQKVGISVQEVRDILEEEGLL